MSLPVRGAWIEIRMLVPGYALAKSLPVRGAWIEMLRFTPPGRQNTVAPRKGSVD